MFISAFCFHANQAWQGAYCPIPVLFKSLQTGVRYLDIDRSRLPSLDQQYSLRKPGRAASSFLSDS